MAGDIASELDDLTIATLQLFAGRGVTKAQIRRCLLAEACARARRDPRVARLVTLMLESRLAASLADGVVMPMRRRGRG